MLFHHITRLNRRPSILIRSATVVWRMGTLGLTRLVLAFVFTSASGFAAESLSFHNALTLALQRAPELKAAVEQTSAARSAAIPAGALPDPQLIFGVDNIPIDGANRWDFSAEPMTMQRVGIMQSFLNSEQRNARTHMAQARIGLMQTHEHTAQQRILQDTSEAWIARHTAEQQLALIDALTMENQLLHAAVQAQISAGKKPAVDGILPRQEAIFIAQRVDDLTAQRAQAIANLRRYLGNVADDELQGDAPTWSLDHHVLLQSLPDHPVLRRYRPEAKVLDAEVAEAKAAKTPNWALELAYQKRGAEFGDMAMVQVRVDLPLFSSTRQDPLIIAKQSERAALNETYNANLRELQAMLERDWVDYQRLQQAEARYHNDLMPLAHEKIQLSMAQWRSGKGTLSEVVNARRENIDTRLAALAITGARQQAAANLVYAYGLSNEFYQGH